MVPSSVRHASGAYHMLHAGHLNVNFRRAASSLIRLEESPDDCEPCSLSEAAGVFPAEETTMASTSMGSEMEENDFAEWAGGTNRPVVLAECFAGGERILTGGGNGICGTLVGGRASAGFTGVRVFGGGA